MHAAWPHEIGYDYWILSKGVLSFHAAFSCEKKSVRRRILSHSLTRTIIISKIYIQPWTKLTCIKWRSCHVYSFGYVIALRREFQRRRSSAVAMHFADVWSTNQLRLAFGRRTRLDAVKPTRRFTRWLWQCQHWSHAYTMISDWRRNARLILDAEYYARP